MNGSRPGNPAAIRKPMRTVAASALIGVAAVSAAAQTNRLASPVNPRRMATLSGNRHPGLIPQFDRGPVDPSLPIHQITLFMKPSEGQQAALEQLLADQQDPFSPTYHRWLQPAEYADRFGVSSDDLAEITLWLQSAGFRVDYVPPSRNFVVFSGTAQQVQAAFATEIHSYQVDGELHFANASEPSVPADLAPLVRGLHGLDDFRLNPGIRQIRPVPEYTSGSGNHYLSPDDFATIYNLSPLYAAGYDGTGQQVAIVGQCNIGLADVRQFRSTYGLSPNDPQTMLVPGSQDPGNGNSGDCGEAYLDVEWAGAVARNAQILYLYSTSAFADVQYAISQNLAPVISFSFGSCEATTSSGLLDYMRQLAQQANAQGTTWMVSSGDSGAAGCDRNFSPPPATHGLAVSLPASVPEITAVGGTTFNDGGGTYWNFSNSATGASALGSIPETAWNDTASIGELAASGGGQSVHYLSPPWQSALGVASNGMRAVPDVALAASTHTGYLGVVGGARLAFAGTSASAPAFSGIVALLNHYQVANHFQAQTGMGNLNPGLYGLSQRTSSAFHDITSGNNIVPCAQTADCLNGFLGYSAGPGYDMVTGLGSVDANALISSWSNAVFSTTTSVTANPATFLQNASTVITATVKAVSSSSAPGGVVVFTAGNTTLGSPTLVSSGGSSTASVTVPGSRLSVGVNMITAAYGGSSNFNPSTGTVTVTVTAPAITSLSPSSVVANSPPFTLRVIGAGFVSGSSVNWNGRPLLTTFVSPNELDTLISNTATLGSFGISVSLPGGLTTNSLAFNITLPVTASTVTSSFPHLAKGGGYVSGIYVINSGTQSAGFSIRFYDDSGTPTAVPLDGVGATSILSGLVAPRGAAYYETTGPFGDPVSGSGAVTSDPGISLQVLFRHLTGADSYSEAAVPISSGSNEILFTFDDTVAASGAQIYTGVAIANPDSMNAANVMCTARDAAGNVIPNAVTVPVLNPLGHWADYLFPPLLNNRGTLDCSSNTRIASVGIRASANAISSLPTIPITAATGSLNSTIPHVAAGGGWVTGFTVVNRGNQSAAFSVTFYDDAGHPGSVLINNLGSVTTLSGTVPPHGANYYETTATQPLSGFSGSGLITADAAIQFQVLFRRVTLDGSYYEATAPTSTGNFEVEIPFDDTNSSAFGDQIYTGLAISNTDPANSAAVVCTARDPAGNVIPNAVTVPVLNPLGHWADYLFLPLVGHRGSLDCSSNTKIGSIGIRASGPNAVSSLPVISIR